MQTSLDIRNHPNYKRALFYENEILKTLFDVDNELQVIDVEIDFRSQQTFIHTYFCGSENKKVLVFLHGYLGSSLSFFKMIKPLSSQFKIYCIDLIGMGLSGRVEIEAQESDPREIIDYFVESVEQWRVSLGLQNFALIGHSFGGYIAMNYAQKHPQVIKNSLFLFSPMGGTQVTPENDLSQDKNFLNHLNQQPVHKKLYLKLSRYVGKNKITLKQFLDQWFIPKQLVLGRTVSSKFHIHSKNEKNLWIKYLMNLFDLPESTDKYIYFLVSFPKAQPRLSLEEIIRNQCRSLPFSIHVLYGDKDWMNSDGFLRLFEQKFIRGTMSIVQGSDHHLILQQTEALANFIFNNYNQNIIPKMTK